MASVLDEIFGTKTNTTEMLPVKAIRMDGGTQMRALIHPVTIEEYRDALLAGANFPPILVYYDGESYWLADGFHRVRAHVLAYQMPGGPGEFTKPTIAAEVRAGTRRDAILYAASANALHGLRRTNEDKRRAVMALLEDPEWATWSDGEIAKRCAVSQPFVSKLRPKPEPTHNGYESTPIVRKGADGREINVAGIGKSQSVVQWASLRDVEAFIHEWQQSGELDVFGPEPHVIDRIIAEAARRDLTINRGTAGVALLNARNLIVGERAAAARQAKREPVVEGPPMDWAKYAEDEQAKHDAAQVERNLQRREGARSLIQLYNNVIASETRYSELTGDFMGTVPVVEGLRKMIAGLERLMEALQ